MDNKNGIALKATDIKKSFGSTQALKGVSFEIPRNSVFTILGPNGAGKTTLISILTSVKSPDSGKVLIEGHNIHSDTIEVRKIIGSVAQENNFDRFFTVWNNLVMHAKMHGMTKAEYEPRITELLKQVGLYERRNDFADEFSGGMKRRISLIRAMIHRPKILFLDEPTTGLDPVARRQLWTFIEEFKQNATVVLTTHYMDEADKLSDEIMILDEGLVVMQDTPRNLKQATSLQNRYELCLESPIADNYVINIQDFLKAHDASQSCRVEVLDEFRIAFTLSNKELLRQMLAVLPFEEIHRLGVAQTDLETVFMAVAQSEKKSASVEKSS